MPPLFLINQSSTIGVIHSAMTANSTGSDFLTFFLLGVVALVVLSMMFRLPLELTGLFVMPILLVLSAYISDFTPILGFVLFYITFVLAKHFIFVR